MAGAGAWAPAAGAPLPEPAPARAGSAPAPPCLHPAPQHWGAALGTGYPPSTGEPAARPHAPLWPLCSCLTSARSWWHPAWDPRGMGTVSELCASSFQAFLCPSVAAKAGRQCVPPSPPCRGRGFPSPSRRGAARGSGSIWPWLHMAPAESSTGCPHRLTASFLCRPSQARASASTEPLQDGRAPGPSPGIALPWRWCHAGQGCWGASGGGWEVTGTAMACPAPAPHTLPCPG